MAVNSTLAWIYFLRHMDSKHQVLQFELLPSFLLYSLMLHWFSLSMFHMRVKESVKAGHIARINIWLQLSLTISSRSGSEQLVRQLVKQISSFSSFQCGTNFKQQATNCYEGRWKNKFQETVGLASYQQDRWKAFIWGWKIVSQRLT